VEFAQKLAAQYETDLTKATQIVLSSRRVIRDTPAPRRPRGGGSSSRAAAGTLRLVNTVGAAISDRRSLGSAEASVLPLAAALLLLIATLTLIWPRLIAVPLAIIALWIGAGLVVRYWRVRRQRPPPAT
jgi:cardiolipin synthase